MYDTNPTSKHAHKYVNEFRRCVSDTQEKISFRVDGSGGWLVDVASVVAALCIDAHNITTICDCLEACVFFGHA